MYKFSLRCLKGFVVITFEQSKQSLGGLKGFVVYYNVLRTLRVSPMFGGGVAFAAQHEVQKFLTSTLHIRRFMLCSFMCILSKNGFSAVKSGSRQGALEDSPCICVTDIFCAFRVIVRVNKRTA